MVVTKELSVNSCRCIRRLIAVPAKLTLATLLLSASGCYHVSYSNGGSRGHASKSGTNHFFIAGLVNTSEVNLAQVCPDGVDKLDIHQTFGDGLLGGITLGIYTPRSWEAWCSPAAPMSTTTMPLSGAATPTVETPEPAPVAEPIVAPAPSPAPLARKKKVSR